jgi:hypothetical protein
MSSKPPTVGVVLGLRKRGFSMREVPPDMYPSLYARHSFQLNCNEIEMDSMHSRS